jgi:hypothetical protein
MTAQIEIPALTNASSQYGASMGRGDTHDDESKSLPVTFQLQRMGWEDGDYDSGGAYWGYAQGENIYRAYCPDGVDVQIDLYKRAESFREAEALVREDYPLATFEYREDEAEEKFWYTSSSGLIEFQMTRQQAESVSHSGQCDADVAKLMTDPFIARQLAEIKPEDLREELGEYGSWDAEELADHDTNLSRILWLAGGDIRDNNPREEAV